MDTIYYIIASAVCAGIFLLVYRSLRAPFFIFLLAAVSAIACASAAQSYTSDPGAGALFDILLALGGAGLAAASLTLTYSFRLAGDSLD